MMLSARHVHTVILTTFLGSSFLGSLPLLAQSPPASQTPPGTVATGALPVRRVVLYKTGVGYFEHLGQVRNRQDVTVRFTSAQLNDVLKSLTAVDLGTGRVTGISYNSIAPLEQRLGALRLPLGEAATMVELLGSLRGARLDVTAGTARVTGRLVSVERQTRLRNDREQAVDTLTIVTDAGTLRTFDLGPAVGVRIADGDLRQELARYLDVMGSTRDQDVRQMVISTTGAGERPLFVSYISEVPIWKTTYRLVLRDGGARPLLHGWAIIDNTIGEDWKDVELSLVAGAPQSFIQDVSQPHYGRRPTVPLPRTALLTPQTHQAAVAVAVAGLHAAEAPKEIVPEAPPPSLRDSVSVQNPSARPVERAGVMAGIPGGTIGGIIGGLPAAPPPPAAPSRVRAEMANQMAAADAASLGDLFEYRIKERVSLQKNQSALVPIVTAEVTAEKVALWSRAQGRGRPLRAVWITNGSGLTLDGGSIAVVDGDAFAGEGLIEPLKPGERRLLSYAADSGILVDARLDSPPGRVVRLRARDGIVIQETEGRATWTYAVRSEESTPSTLVIEHQRRPGWTLAAGQAPAETTPDAYRFRLAVGPGQEARLDVREVSAGETRVAVGDIDDSSLVQMAGYGESTAAFRQALAPILEKKAELARHERELATFEERVTTVVSDQARLRENMKALRGSSQEKQLLRRYTGQLDAQEDRLAELRASMAAARTSHDKARAELDALIASLTFDAD